MEALHFVLLFGGCFILVNGQTCADMDTDVCKRLSAKFPEMCADGCFSSICTRFCGHCPLKCYTCHETDHPVNCTVIVDCPTYDHYCFTTQTFTDDFREVYKMGCAKKDICQQQVNNGRRSNLDVKGGCCNTDKCNNILPQQIDLLPLRTTVAVQNTTALPPIYETCENIDNDICLRISLANPAFCSNDCIASRICPRMCRKCFKCYDCNDINRPEDCNTTSTCQAGKECFQLETLSIDLRPVFRLGCLDENLCQRFGGSPVQSGFGRRQQGISLKGGCCKTDLCNGRITKAVTTPMPTTKAVPATTASHFFNCANIRHNCPVGYTYVLKDHYCYHVGNTLLTQQESELYCKNHCGRLADDLLSTRELAEVLDHVDAEKFSVWVDAAKDIHDQWVWINSHRKVDSSLTKYMTVIFGHTRHSCAAAYLNHGRGYLNPYSCTTRLYPLCKTNRS